MPTMPHGYTNRTTGDGRVVAKSYQRRRGVSGLSACTTPGTSAP
jgi:hypothetical protein